MNAQATTATTSAKPRNPTAVGRVQDLSPASSSQDHTPSVATITSTPETKNPNLTPILPLRRRDKTDQRKLNVSATELITTYRSLVESILHKFPTSIRFAATADINDLRQEAHLALLAAHNHFNPTQGILFTTYATTCIKNALCSHLRTLDPLPERARRDVDLIQSAYNADPKHETTLEHLTRATGLTPDRVTKLRLWEKSAYTTAVEELNELPDTHQARPEEIAEQNDTAARVRKAILALPEKKRRILLAHLINKTPMREIAATENVSLSHVSKVCSAVVSQLVTEYLD